MQYNKHYEIYIDEIERYNEYLRDYPKTNKYTTDIDAEIKRYNISWLRDIQISFMRSFLNAVESSSSDYFLGCTFSVYKSCYQDRYANFLKYFTDVSEIDFINKELDAGILKIKYDLLVPMEQVKDQITYSLQKRFEFLQQRAETSGYTLTYDNHNSKASKKEVYTLELMKKSVEPIKKGVETKQEHPVIDYSKSSVTEKIIALNEAGVLEFLQTKDPFNLSVNRLAEYLSLCIGEKSTTIQSYINAILNDSDITKSPYKTDKTVKKVKQKLIQMGLKIE